MLLLLLLLSRYGCCCATVWGTPRLGRRGNGHSLSLGTGRYSSLAAAAGRDPMTTRKRMADLHVIRRVLPIIFDMHHRAAGGWPPVSWEVVPLSPAQPPGVLGRVSPVLRLALREVVPFMRSLGHMRRWFAGYSRLATETGVVPCNAQPVACAPFLFSLSLSLVQRRWQSSAPLRAAGWRRAAPQLRGPSLLGLESDHPSGQRRPSCGGASSTRADGLGRARR